jgi:hypothetical protein
MLRLALILPLVWPAAALAGPITYDVHAGGLRVGTLSVATRDQSDTYEITVEAEATGFMGAVTRSHYSGKASGTFDAAGLPVPGHFRALSERIFKSRDTEISFEAGTPVRVSLSPDRDRTDFTDPAMVPDARLDSLSYFRSLFTTAAGACPPDGALYDGRRLVSVAFAPPDAQDGNTRCAGSYRIDHGPDHSMQNGRRSFTMVLVYPPEGGAPSSLTITAGKTDVLLTRTAD